MYRKYYEDNPKDLKNYPIILFVMQNTLNKNIEYQLFERRPQF